MPEAALAVVRVAAPRSFALLPWLNGSVGDAEVDTPDGTWFRHRLVRGVIVLHGGLCPHVEVETVLNFVVMECGSLQVVVIVEQVCGVWRVTLFVGRTNSR